MSGFQPDDRHTVTPRVFTRDVAGLVRFMKIVFDARGDVREGAPAEIQIGDSTIMVSDGDGVRQATPACLYVYVPDADEAFRRATGAGARAIDPPANMPWGDRRATVEDDFGVTWQIATHRGA